MGISCLRFGLDFTPLGISCPRISSDFTPLGISCLRIRADFTPGDETFPAFRADFHPVGYGVTENRLRLLLGCRVSDTRMSRDSQNGPEINKIGESLSLFRDFPYDCIENITIFAA